MKDGSLGQRESRAGGLRGDDLEEGECAPVGKWHKERDRGETEVARKPESGKQRLLAGPGQPAEGRSGGGLVTCTQKAPSLPTLHLVHVP